MNKRKIDKIAVMTFAMSFLIVWIHNGPIMSNEECSVPVLRMLGSFDRIIHQVLSFVVPLYFMISGFLFYNGLECNKIGQKVYRRIFSLGVPFIIWNTISYVIVRGAVYCGILPSKNNESSLILALVNSTCSDLWFLRYLMVLIAVSPILYLFLRRRKTAWCAWFCFLFLKFKYGTLIPVFPNYYLPIYYFGGVMALHYKDTFINPSTELKRLSFIGMLFLIVTAGILNFESNQMILSIYGIAMPIAFWFGIDYIVEKICDYKTKEYMSTNFFIYINHYNVMRIVLKILSDFALGTFFIVILYFIIPCTVFIVLLWLGIIWKKHSPRSWYIVNGGRG